jgi:hypothetical protein
LNNNLISKDKEDVENAIVKKLMDSEYEWGVETLEVVRDIGLRMND